MNVSARVKEMQEADVSDPLLEPVKSTLLFVPRLK
jgi:hypothetical protein